VCRRRGGSGRGTLLCVWEDEYASFFVLCVNFISLRYVFISTLEYLCVLYKKGISVRHRGVLNFKRRPQKTKQLAAVD
jgi:hypothetical protein